MQLKNIFNFFKEPELLNSEQIKSNLDSYISPKLKDIGLKYYGNYFWFSDSINGIRKVVHYINLKGASGILTWGVCLDFVPTFSKSNTIRWNRTENSLKLHLFEWPKDYKGSFQGEGLNFTRVSHWGEKEFKKSLNKHFDENKEDIFEWLSKANSIDEVIQIAKYQINAQGYSIHSPNPEYVLLFLYAQKKQINESLAILEQLNINKVVKDKIIKIIS